MKTLRLLPLTLAISTLLALPTQAQSLTDLYQSAKAFDASYQSAKSQFEATLAKGEQARAGLLPSVNLGSSVNRNNVNSDIAAMERSYGNQGVTLSASQPLYRPANVATAEQGKKQAALAQAQLEAANQDLIVRVSQAYFDVLAAQDTLRFVTAQKSAVSEQLASAKRNFEVGTATITDTREAQAKADLVLAQEIAADNDLRVKKLALDQLTGQNAAPKPLHLPTALPVILPAEVSPWVAESEDIHPSVRQARIALEVAELETQKAQAGHKPTLDLTGSYGVTHNNGSSSLTQDYRTNVATVGLSFNLPLFAGFAIQNRLKETVALEEKSRSDLDAARRGVAQATRSAFFGVQSGMGQVKAYEAAEASSQSALDATKLGYQVGVRINIDVLNAQTTLYDTKAKLAKARYDVLLGNLKLRQANGSLKEEDINAINALLEH
ncbi:TolC family outer membrane protein [Rhodoferax sp. U11-2br]|uniref:TolC family outer membrane protein n=1 Tax=Rhodoferax sp. U11-2br TaxID=2838878 RepID=UPI001BE76AA2|nr:TolC family outer membrane protein [Rhodoferax sp. U11-2br]MBT3069057.1 TolC family outer membrane protein [Rhodoferax sp. U11-2br]